MYYGSAESWNLRDGHMFDTLKTLLDFRGAGGPGGRLGSQLPRRPRRYDRDGHRRGTNLGELCRCHSGFGALLVGFGTDRGTVAAADDWGGPMQIKRVGPSHPASYERLCRDSGVSAFVLPLRSGGR